MKLADLTVGDEYYLEPRARNWGDYRFRDITNQGGRNKVRLLDNQLFYDSWDHGFSRAGEPQYRPANGYHRGVYVKVLILGGTNPDQGLYYGRDREAYVTLTSLRGPWDAVAEETRATLARLDRQRAERDQTLATYQARTAAIIDRAGQAGLTVTARDDGARPASAQRYAITEDDLVLFLNGLEATLNAAYGAMP